MVNFFTFSSVFSFLACLVLGVLYAWIMYRKLVHLPVRLRVLLSALRVVSITLISWILFAPLFKKVTFTPQKPIIVLAHDNSLSVAQIKSSGFDEKAYRKDMNNLVADLSSTYEVKTYSFSDTVKGGLDFSGKGKLTNGTALISQLNNELLNRNLGAIIIASDGIFNRGGNPLYSLKELNAPVYTIALGDTVPKRDVLVADVSYNDLVYLDNEFTLGIQVQAYQSKGETTRLTVSENGIKIKDEQVDLNANGFVKNIPMKFKANKVCVQKYSINVSTIKNEITTKNNTQTIFVEVIDARQKILLASSIVHPDITTLKQAIELNRHYEVTAALADDLNKWDVNSFSLAILYQFPEQGSFHQVFMNKVRESKIPLWFILGAQTSSANFNSMQNLVKLNRTTGSMQEIFGWKEQNFTLFTADPKAMDQLVDYDPLLSPFGNLSINGSYSALLNQKIGRVNTQSPLWFFMNDQGRKIGFLLGEGIWKWKLEEAKDEQSLPLVNELISKSIQYLSVKDDKRKFKVYTNKSTFEENEPVVLNATLYNEAYEPVNSPDAMVQIKSEKGKLFNYQFSKSGNSYRLDAGSLPEGNYSYQASTTFGNQKYSAVGSFYINGLITEYQQTTANHQLLYTMANQNSGKMVMPDQLLGIVNELQKNDNIKTIRYEDRKYEELINFKWLFAFILLLLSTEWFLRKRNGEA